MKATILCALFLAWIGGIVSGHANLLILDAGEDSSTDVKMAKDYNHPELRTCFNDYRGWTAPEQVQVNLLAVLCKYIQIQKVEYIHHSDVREKSLHVTGDALDFRFKVPRGEDPVHFFREHTIGLWYFLIAGGHWQFGFAPYLDTPDEEHFFWQLDTGRGEVPGRRWARVNRQYVSFGVGIDELIRMSRERY